MNAWIQNMKIKCSAIDCYYVACKPIQYCIQQIYYSCTENLPVREIKWESNWKGKGPILCWQLYNPSNKETKRTNHYHKNNIGRPAWFTINKYEKDTHFLWWVYVRMCPCTHAYVCEYSVYLFIYLVAFVTAIRAVRIATAVWIALFNTSSIVAR